MSLHKMPEADTPEEGGRRDAKRKDTGRGGKRRRSLNVSLLLLSMFLLALLCVLLIARVRMLDGRLERMTAKLEQLTGLTAQQKELIEQLTEETHSAMGSSAVVGHVEKNPEDQGKEETGTEEKKDHGREEAGTEEKEPGIQEEEGLAAHRVYLTFDDGPDANTEKILEILDRYDVKATFFVVGTACEGNEEILRDIVDGGHTLGMHSYSHDYAELYASLENFGDDLKREQDFLYEATGVKSMVYRFPGGSSNRVSDMDMKEFAKYLDSQGVRFFDWNISSGDGGSYLFPAETIVENCTKDVGQYGTSVVLMHGCVGKETTLEALPTIIEKIQAMEDTVLLPITEGTEPVQHIKWQDNK